MHEADSRKFQSGFSYSTKGTLPKGTVNDFAWPNGGGFSTDLKFAALPIGGSDPSSQVASRVTLPRDSIIRRNFQKILYIK